MTRPPTSLITGRPPLFGKAGADPAEHVGDGWRLLGSRGGAERQASGRRGKVDGVVIDTWRADLDLDERAGHLRFAGSRRQRDHRHGRGPFRKVAAIGRDPQGEIGFPAPREARRIETPGVVLGLAARESDIRRKAREPGQGHGGARRIVRCHDGQAGEPRPLIEIAHQPGKHLDDERAESGG